MKNKQKQINKKWYQASKSSREGNDKNTSLMKSKKWYKPGNSSEVYNTMLPSIPISSVKESDTIILNDNSVRK